MKNAEKIRRKQRKYYRKNRKRIIKKSTAWAKKHPKRTAQLHEYSRIKRIYKLTREQHKEIYRIQKGRCAICFIRLKGTGCIDHNHKTNEVRGLLCKFCNWGLGNFKDSLTRLKSAVSYMRKHAISR